MAHFEQYPSGLNQDDAHLGKTGDKLNVWIIKWFWEMNVHHGIYCINWMGNVPWDVTIGSTDRLECFGKNGWMKEEGNHKHLVELFQNNNKKTITIKPNSQMLYFLFSLSVFTPISHQVVIKCNPNFHSIANYVNCVHRLNW